MKIWKVKEWKANKGKQFFLMYDTYAVRFIDGVIFFLGDPVSTIDGPASIEMFDADFIHVYVKFDFKVDGHIIRHAIDKFEINNIKSILKSY